MAEDERSRFLPPSADPPRYGVAGLPAPPPDHAAAPPVPGRNYSTADPGLARATVSETAPDDASNGMAVASLSLSVVGLALLVVTFGLLSFVSVPCSIAGWVLGHRAKRRPGEQGMAQAGLITGFVGTVVGIAALVAWILLVVAADDAWEGSWGWG